MKHLKSKLEELIKKRLGELVPPDEKDVKDSFEMKLAYEFRKLLEQSKQLPKICPKCKHEVTYISILNDKKRCMDCGESVV